MEKPTILLIEEFKENLANIINQSQLPVFVMNPIVRELSGMLEQQEQRLLIMEKTRYEAEKEKGAHKDEK